MKKLLLITTTSVAFITSSTSFAETVPYDNADMNSSISSTSMENQWYVKLNVGGVIFNKQQDKATRVKMKSNTSFTGEIGGGYYIMDNLRTDFTIGTVTGGHLKKSVTNKFPSGNTVTATVKHKPTVISFLFNGYVDFIDLNMFKVFAGVGVGPAFVKEKITTSYTGGVNNASYTNIIKNKINFAYQLSLGTSFKVAQNIKAELVYSWKDYGKTKDKTIITARRGNTLKVGGTHYKGNNLIAGLRFDI